METIHEDEELEIEEPKKIEEKNKVDRDFTVEAIEKYIRENRKKYKNFKKKPMKQMQPPKWLCMMTGCTWGGRTMDILLDHIKKHHPTSKLFEFEVEKSYYDNFNYSNPRNAALEKIGKNIEERKVEDLSEKIKKL